MREYKRLIKQGYIAIKEYKRFILFSKLNGIKTCLLKVDLNNSEKLKVIEDLKRWDDE